MKASEKQETIKGAKEWVKFNLPTALQIANKSYSKLIILSTIDSFAQMWSNYPLHDNKNTFCNFILNYSSQNIDLNHVCPVTLCYHYKKEEFLNLQPTRIYKWNDPILMENADRILYYIEDEKKREKAQKQHTYIALLYQLRNKIVHELNNLGTPIEFNNDVPSIASGGQFKRVWSVNYPVLWLYNLATEIINNFLDDCLKNEERLCFLDNPRLIKLTWYD